MTTREADKLQNDNGWNAFDRKNGKIEKQTNFRITVV